MPATYNLSDAFISYSRRDTAFVRQLDEALKRHNREVWVDWEDIPLTADWWEEIRAGIEGANTFIFIISPDSVLSEICYDEIQHAVTNNKRMIPVLHRDILDNEMKAKMHPAISTHNWIFFREDDNFDEAVERLLSALESDLNHLRMHTRFLVRAREWDARGRDRSFLLSGGEVHEAEDWITAAGTKEPRPNELHTDYILASRAAQNQRQRRILLGISVALVVALALGALSFILFQSSQRNLIIAENNAATATIAQGQALLEADRAGTQAAIAQNNAATATVAQGRAQIEANNAATQAAIAQDNAATATVAQGQSIIDANRASTQAAAAQTAAAAEANARATSSINEQIAQTQAVIAAIAQVQAMSEAERAVRQAEIAQNNAATATIAQGRAQIEANNAATQAAIAQNNAATATVAQGQSIIEADRASTQAALAQNNAATATVAQGEAQIREQEARAQALTVRAEQALNFGDTRIALALALESARLNPNLLQTQSVLNRIAAYSPVLVVDDVRRGSFSLDGSSLLALNRAQNTLSLWDIAQRQKRYEINGHETIINDFAFSRDGRQIITVSQDGRVGMWNAADGSLIRSLDDQGTPVNRVLMHPDGRRFITAGTNGVIFLRNLSDGEKIGELRTTTPDTFDQIYFNADGRALYAWSAAPPIVMSRWDVERGILLPRQTQRFVYFARNGLFRISDDGAGLLLHSTDGDGVMLRLPANIAEILDFTPDGRGILVRTREDQSLALLDRMTGRVVRTFTGSGVSDSSSGQLALANRNTTASTARNALFAQDGTTVLSVLADNRVVMWDVRDGRLIRQIGVSDLELANGGMSHDSRYALTTAEDGTARVLDMTGLQSTTITSAQERRSLVQQIINSRRDSGGLYGEFYTVNWRGLTSPDGNQWLFNYDGFNLALRDLQTGDTAVLENTLDNSSSSIRLFTPDSRYVVVGFRSGPIRVWDIHAKQWKWNTLRVPGAVNLEEIRFTPDTDHMIAFYDQTAIRWNLETGEEDARYTKDNTITVLSRLGLEDETRYYTWFVGEPQNQIMRDGQQVARFMLDTSSNTALLLLWDTATGQLLRETNLLSETTASQRFGARFSPDGSAYVRVGLVDNSIEMFSTRTGEKTRRFFGHSDVVNGVGFSPDGQRLLSSAQNRELLLWDVTNGQLVRPLETGRSTRQPPTSTNIIFLPDGEAAAYPSDTTLSLDMPVIRIETLSDVVSWVQANRQIPVLTCAEREQYRVFPLCEDTGDLVATPTAVATSSPVPTPTLPLQPTATLVPSPTPFPVGTIEASLPVNLRSGPSQEYRITGTVMPGTIVEIIEQSGNWLKVRLRDNTEGWLIRDVVRR
jgi:WD40 repeat protein